MPLTPPAEPRPHPSVAAERVQAAARVVRRHLGNGTGTEVALIAGSGLSGLAERMESAWRLPYADIPGWPRSTVPGHAGFLAGGRLGGRACLLAAGRAHLYEGYRPDQLVFNVRVFQVLGIRTLVVTNAAGGLNPDYEPGDLMVLGDHIFLPGLSGQSPLVGPNDDALGPRFPAVAGAYDLDLQDLARTAAKAEGLRAHTGVYAMVAGPSYESPAEARFLRAIGADAVGMSTAPEVVAARHGGMRVLGLSLITNRVLLEQPRQSEPAIGDLHAEVTAAGAAAAGKLGAAMERVLRAMD